MTKERSKGGLLERFLSAQRGGMADRLISEDCRQGRILDIGCGAQPIFLEKTGFAEKFGIDRLMDSQVAEQTPGVTLVNRDVEKDGALPFEDGYFDAVTMLAVFEHIEPVILVEILKDIRRVLKPGGVYIMTTPSAWADGLLRVMDKFGLIDSALFAEHKDVYSPTKIAALLKRSGFADRDLKFGYFELFANIWGLAKKN